MKPKFKRIYTNAVFRGKLLFSIENWGGAKKSLLTEIQKLQNQASKTTLQGTLNIERMSSNQRQEEMGWLPIQTEIQMATDKMVHKVINREIPAGISALMPLNTVTSRIQIHRKLAAKPRALNKNQVTASSFRSRAHMYNCLPGRITSLTDTSKFKKWIKIYRTKPHKVPIDLNQKQMDAELRKLNDKNRTQGPTCQNELNQRPSVHVRTCLN